uniref:Uncharacterized protein n=1 Tax=Zea mays TaxID=4577 RepID=C4J7F6_MAIZE|nr:unknown [Zea mays]
MLIAPPDAPRPTHTLMFFITS